MPKAPTKQPQKAQRGPGKSAAQKKLRNGAAQKNQSHSARSSPKEHTRADQILALLRQPGGATLKAIMAATNWQAHSVRGFISGHLVKKLGLVVLSLRRDGERVYAIRSMRSQRTFET